MKKTERIIVDLGSGRPVDYTLKDLRGKEVFDTYGNPVLVTETGLWVHLPFSENYRYDKYVIVENFYRDGSNCIRPQLIGATRDGSNGCKAPESVVEDLDRLEAKLK